MNRIAALTAIAVLLSGCSQSTPQDLEPGFVEHRVRLVEFQGGAETTTIESTDSDVKWGATVQREATPEGRDPADYGANEAGEYWQDTIIEARAYNLGAGAAITTHTHGVVIIATESITIDGRINVRGLGAAPLEAGYPTTRAAMLDLYRAYGQTDEATGEPLLWGAGGPDCNGGGYIILRAPTIILNGELDAGSDCGQGGIIYLEGNTSGSGVITASLVIRRGDTA